MYVWLFIVPVIAKGLSKVEDIAKVNIFEYSFELKLGLPFSWKVFYFSALTFAAANLLFLWKCYSLIKDHSSFSEFKEAGKGQKQLDGYAEEASLPSIDWSAFDNLPDDMRLENRYIQEPFWEVFDNINVARPVCRIWCSFLYLLGFILVAIILCQNLYTVLRLTF